MALGVLWLPYTGFQIQCAEDPGFLLKQDAKFQAVPATTELGNSQATSAEA